MALLSSTISRGHMAKVTSSIVDDLSYGSCVGEGMRFFADKLSNCSALYLALQDFLVH